MIKRNNKKGFTIVELVIVIAVIAILAAVLIPTFAGIIKKANISKDTQLAKNLNTILISEEAEGNKPADFSEVLSVLRENGYVVENLNPTTEGCYFVWESASNQIMLVDKDFQIIYVAEALTENTSISATWFFAVKDAELVEAVKAAGGSVVPAVDTAWIAGDATKVKELLTQGGVVTLNESITLDVAPKHSSGTKNDAIRLVGTTVTYNLAGQTMTATTAFDTSFKNENGVKTGYALIHAGKDAVVALEDGNIVASVQENENGLSLYGVLRVFDGASATVENMNVVYNGASTGAVGGTGAVFCLAGPGTMTVKDTVVTVANAMGAEVGEGTATFENVTFKNAGDGAWNDICVGVSYGGTANIKSGTYVAATSGDKSGYCVGILSSGGTLNISGGTFEGGLLMTNHNAEYDSVINITGGTFNGKASNSLTAADWATLAGVDASCVTGAGTNNVTIKVAK